MIASRSRTRTALVLVIQSALLLFFAAPPDLARHVTVGYFDLISLFLSDVQHLSPVGTLWPYVRPNCRNASEKTRARRISNSDLRLRATTRGNSLVFDYAGTHLPVS